MKTLTDLSLLASGVASDVEVDHLYCECDPDLSWCDLDISNLPIDDETGDDNMCVVCEDMYQNSRCVRCGG